MPCNSCNPSTQPMFKGPKTPLGDNKTKNKSPAIKNMIVAAGTQSNKVRWFIDGVSGLAKCFTNQKSYSDVQIKANREVCRTCEFSTKNNKGEMTTTSQCMAKDPQTGEICSCYITCLTQTGQCKLNKWVGITINSENIQ